MRALTLRLLPALLLGSTLSACEHRSDDVDDTDDNVDSDTVDVVDTDVVDTEVIDTDAQCWVADDVGTCWDCDLPTIPVAGSALKFLNNCDNGTTSATFDNATRIPASTWVPGTPLPTVP